MSSLPHPVPSRTAHAIAALYGHDDDTLLAWQLGWHDQDFTYAQHGKKVAAVAFAGSCMIAIR